MFHAKHDVSRSSSGVRRLVDAATPTMIQASAVIACRIQLGRPASGFAVNVIPTRKRNIANADKTNNKNGSKMGRSTKRKRRVERRVEVLDDDRCGYDGKKPELVDPKNLQKVDRARINAKFNANHCTICWLDSRNHITGVQWTAAKRIQDDQSLAGQSSIPSTLAALAAGGGGNTVADIAQSKIDADRRKANALNAIGTSARFLIEMIVLRDMALKAVAPILRVQDNAVLPALRVALDALAAHYGLAPKPGEKEPPSRIRTLHPFNNT